MKAKQRGVSLGGLLTWCVIIGVGAIVVMRFWPLYNEKLKVDVAMKSAAESTEIAKLSSREINSLILRNFEVQEVRRFNRKNIKDALKITRAKDGKTRTMKMAYEIRGPFVSNFDLVMKYENIKEIPPYSAD